MLSALECVEVIVFAFVLVLALNRYAYGPRVVSGTPHKAVPWPAEVHDREVLIASQPLYFAKCTWLPTKAKPRPSSNKRSRRCLSSPRSSSRSLALELRVRNSNE